MNQRTGFLTLDTASGVPIYRQIADWVKVCVASGTLEPGDQVPTVRQLAVDLHVNYNTVARAYLELEHLGVVHTLRGKGTFITKREIIPNDPVREVKLQELVTEFLAKIAEFGFSPSEIHKHLGERISGSETKEVL